MRQSIQSSSFQNVSYQFCSRKEVPTYKLTISHLTALFQSHYNLLAIGIYHNSLIIILEEVRANHEKSLIVLTFVTAIP